MTSVAGIEVHGRSELLLEQNLNKQLLRFTTAGSDLTIFICPQRFHFKRLGRNGRI